MPTKRSSRPDRRAQPRKTEHRPPLWREPFNRYFANAVRSCPGRDPERWPPPWQIHDNITDLLAVSYGIPNLPALRAAFAMAAAMHDAQPSVTISDGRLSWSGSIES